MKNTFYFTTIFFFILIASCLDDNQLKQDQDSGVLDQEILDEVDYIVTDQGDLLEFHDFKITNDQG